MAEGEILYKELGAPCLDAGVSVSRFLVVDGEPIRLLIRLFNRLDRAVTAVRLAVYRVGEDGEETTRREFSVTGLFAEPDEEFSVPNIRLPESWRKVRVEVLSARTGDREYDFSDGSVRYLGATPPPRGKVGERVRSPFGKYAAILFLLIGLFAAVTVLLCFRPSGAERAAADALAEYEDLKIHVEI